MDITMVGHISKDIMHYVDGTQKFVGGPVIYSSAAATKAGKKVRVITSAANNDDASLGTIRKLGVDVIRLDSPTTTSIENTYHTADCEKRDVKLISQAKFFDVNIQKYLSGKIIHLAGLFRGEIPDELIPVCAKYGEVAIDAQGVLRCNENGQLSFKDWQKKEVYLPQITYLKTDAAEAEILTGIADRHKALLKLAQWGSKEIMLTHNSEVLIYSDEKIYSAPFTPRNLSGRTGRGDTTFAAYLAWRLDHSPQEAVTFAAALCSIKMESPGPFLGSVDDVLARVKIDNGK